MPEYTVQSPLLHDGDMYETGQPVTMQGKQAEILLAQGVLLPAPVELILDRKQKAVGEMTGTELKEALNKLGVEVPRGTKKAGLVELYVKAVGGAADNGNRP